MSRSVTRLFRQFQPESYDVTWRLDREAMTFSGTVTVRGRKTGRPSQRLTFHQKDLNITSASIVRHDKKGDQEFEPKRINNQDTLNEVRLHTAGQLFPGDYTVTMEFRGAITRPMNGIYPCFFTHDGTEKTLIATQFESHHAREAFPSIDEPEAKATFDMTLVTPAGETALGNTPVKTQTVKNGQQTTRFETTPRMSVYLLAFVTGDMAYTETTNKNGVLIRSYATPDNAALTEYSLDVAARCLEFFDSYFGIPYPLPKLDMVALPDFAVGAMENWGLVTFRETTLLVNPGSSSIESKQVVALVICHELTHQWFGNLVTMKWWDDLWLNESFANMMEYRAVDELFPEWHVWDLFISQDMVSAKRRDSLADVQSVHTAVHHPDEINTIFDPSIVYAKGGAILYTILNYLGEKTFREGLHAYFKKHAYGNTAADDLWAALSTASGQDVGALTHKWLTEPGYPLVTVNWQPGDAEVTLTQRRFLSNPGAENTDTTPWQVPLQATLLPADAILGRTVATLPLAAQPSAGRPLLFAHDGQSYYLPYYAQRKHLQQLVESVKHGTVSATDRFLLLDSYNMLQRGGVSGTTELLELVSAYAGEANETVWSAIAMSLGEARTLIESDEPHERKLDALVASLVGDIAGRLGWDDAAEDSASTLRLRGLIVSMAAGAKIPSVTDEGLKRFAAFKKPGDLPASTRTVVYYCGVRYGSSADFKKLLALHGTIQNADEKEEIASALTASKKPEQHAELLAMFTSGAIRRQDLSHWYAWMIRNRHARAATWQWLLDNWDWVNRELGSDMSFDSFPRYAGSVFSTKATLKQFQNFFEPKKSIVALARNIVLAEQEIKSRVAWRTRNEAAVKAWLEKL